MSLEDREKGQQRRKGGDGKRNKDTVKIDELSRRLTVPGQLARVGFELDGNLLEVEVDGNFQQHRLLPKNKTSSTLKTVTFN